MADNTVLSTNVGTGDTIRTLEDGSSVKWPAGVTAFATTVGTPDVISIVTPTVGLPVRLADGSGYISALPITDNSGSLTVDGTVAVSGVSGNVNCAQSGTWIVGLETGSGSATAVAKVEDAASANGDAGIPALAVQKATPANTAGTDGDYEFLQMSAGRLWTSAVIDTALPAGTNAIGKLAANSGVDIGDVDITSVVPGTGATSLGKAEDAVHASGDTGVMALAVRKDTATQLAGTDGDYAPLVTDASGRLHCNVGNTLTVASHAVTNAGTFVVQVDGTALSYLSTMAAPALSLNSSTDFASAFLICGSDPATATTVFLPVSASLGVQTYNSQAVADNAGFTDGTTKVFCAGYVYDEVAGTALTENDAAAARINVNRAVVSTIEDGATRGRYATVSASNALKVDGSAVTQPVSGTVTANAGSGTMAVSLAAGATAIAKAEDVASADADVGVPAMAVRKATPANTSGTDGDYEMLQMSAGRLWTDTSIGHLAGNTVSTGNGTSGTGVLRVAQVSDGTGVLAGVTTVTTVTTCSTLTGGGVAHDGADSGNPVKVGAKCSLTLSDDTIVANGDRTDATSDGDGALLVRSQFPLGDLLTDATSNTDGASTASGVFTATASTRSYITAISVFRTDAGTTAAYIDFRDGTAGSVLYRMALPNSGGGGGSNIASSVPLFRTSANTALAYDVSSALTTVYINVTGYKSKV